MIGVVSLTRVRVVMDHVEFYLYPTVITALIHLIKPELIR